MLKIAFHQKYVHPLPEGHRFPMAKYELLPQQLLLEGTVDETAFFSPGIIEKELVLSAHTKEYFKNLTNLNLDRKAQRKTGFVHDHELKIGRASCRERV